ARDGDHPVLRMDPLAMELDEILASDPLDRRAGGLLGAEMVLAVEEPCPFPALDRSGRVVSAREALEDAALLDREAISVESRARDHLEEEIERTLEILREAVEARDAFVVLKGAGDVGGEEVRFLIELVGRVARGPSRTHQGRRHRCEPFASLRIEVASDAHVDVDVDEGNGRVLDHEDDRTAGDLMAMLRPIRRRELDRRELELARMRGNRLGAGTVRGASVLAERVRAHDENEGRGGDRGAPEKVSGIAHDRPPSAPCPALSSSFAFGASVASGDGLASSPPSPSGAISARRACAIFLTAESMARRSSGTASSGGSRERTASISSRARPRIWARNASACARSSSDRPARIGSLAASPPSPPFV